MSSRAPQHAIGLTYPLSGCQVTGPHLRDKFPPDHRVLTPCAHMCSRMRACAARCCVFFPPNEASAHTADPIDTISCQRSQIIMLPCSIQRVLSVRNHRVMVGRCELRSKRGLREHQSARTWGSGAQDTKLDVYACYAYRSTCHCYTKAMRLRHCSWEHTRIFACKDRASARIFKVLRRLGRVHCCGRNGLCVRSARGGAAMRRVTHDLNGTFPLSQSAFHEESTASHGCAITLPVSLFFGFLGGKFMCCCLPAPGDTRRTSKFCSRDDDLVMSTCGMKLSRRSMTRSLIRTRCNDCCST